MKQRKEAQNSIAIAYWGSPSSLLGYPVAAAAVWLALIVRIALVKTLGLMPLYVFFYPAVVATAILFGGGPGLVATGLASLAVDYFVLPPVGSLRIKEPSDMVGLAIFMATGAAMSGLAAAYRNARTRASEQEKEEVRKESQNQIRAGEERMHLFVEHAPVAIAMFDRDMRYVAASRRWRDDYALGDRLLFGKSHYDIFPEIPEHWREAHRRGLSGEVLRGEDPFDREDGRTQWIRWELRPWYENAGVLGGIVIFSEDTTASKLAEAKIREGKAQLEAALASMADAVFISDSDGKFLEFNESFAKFHRFRNKGECAVKYSDYADLLQISLPSGEILSPIDWAVPRALRGETVANAERIVRRKDTGETWYGNYSFSPIRDAHGAISGAAVVARDITERKVAEAALWASLERLEKVLEVETVGVMFWDLNTGCMVDANDTFLKLTGYSRSQIEERELTWEKLTPPEYLEVSRSEITKFHATGRVGPYEKQYFRKDGTRVWLLFAGSSLGNNQCVEFCVDISDRKRAEDALRDSEEKFRTLVNFVPQIVWMCTPDGLNIYFNQRWVDYTGLSLEESYGKGWNTPFHDDDKQLAWNAWNRAVATGNPYQVESRLRAANGTYRWFLMQGTPLRDASGEVVKWFGTCTDIEDVKRTEDALRRSEEQFRTMADAIPQLAWIANADGWISWYNQRWYEYTGTTPAEMEGWGWQSVHDPVALPDVMQRWQASIATGDRFAMTFPLLGANGKFQTFLTRAEPIKDESGKVLRWFGTNTNIHEQQEIEDALRDSEERYRELSQQLEMRVLGRTAELEAANKELESFSYSVSHDLRAPLRAIDGFSRATLEDYGEHLPVEGREYLEIICRSTKRMGELIDDLLAFSRLNRQPLSAAEIDPHRIVDSCLEELRSAHPERDINIHVGDLPHCIGDRALLKQVWLNLLSNAIKFSSKRVHPDIHVGSQFVNGEVVYFVRDNGAGFDMRYADKLFGVFQRLHRTTEFEGTGVGLAIVHRVISRHGGRIWAEAIVNQGATFYFTLPSEIRK